MKKLLLLLLLGVYTGIFAQSGSMEFTSSGTFTVPDGVTTIFIEVVGAGGSGGYNGTGGGGGGGYASGNYSVTPGQVIAIAVGSPGVSPMVGTTSVEGFLSASGGENGVSVPNPEIGGGGDGGIGAGGNIVNHTGGNGGGGYYTYFGGGGGGAAGAVGDGADGGNTIAWTGICLTPGGDGGISGGVPGGNGGKGAGFTDAFCNVTDPAAVGANYGGGGGGGNGNGGAPANGAGGYCFISWCNINVGIVANEDVIAAEETDATFQWINCDDNSIIEGETGNAFIPEVSGNYAVIVNDGICADTSECVAFTVIEQSISDLIGQQITISPNPVYDVLHIIAPAGMDFTYALFSTTGQCLWISKDVQHPVSHLNNGIYLLRISNENAYAWKLFVKE